jgi:N-acetylmuramoyl-L-alanine amidase
MKKNRELHISVALFICKGDDIMAKPKVFLGVGHGGNDPGAVKFVREEDVNLNMAKGCRDYLEGNGVQVKMSRTKDENDTLNEEIKECNAYKPDLAVDIHNNAGGGDGFECYYHFGGGTSKTLAQNIEKEVKAINQNSRGIKAKKGADGRDYYGFIRETACPSVITEGLFVDNKTDVKIADTVAEQVAFGVAIAKGIIATLKAMGKLKTTIKKEPAKKTETNSKSYKVKITADVLNVRAGAGKNYKVNTTIKYNEAYTIVDEKNCWGKLKSGAGWISLDYTKKV